MSSITAVCHIRSMFTAADDQNWLVSGTTFFGNRRLHVEGKLALGIMVGVNCVATVRGALF